MDNIEFVKNRLKKYGAEIYEYRGVKFIGIKNTYSDNNMAITFGNEENVMEFTYQTARFAAGDLEGLIAHAEKFLKNELCAAEFFLGGKRLFGGSRTVAGTDFSSLDELLGWYCGGNEKIAENLRGFFKNDGITLAALCWNGKADRHVRILPDGKIENI